MFDRIRFEKPTQLSLSSEGCRTFLKNGGYLLARFHEVLSEIEIDIKVRLFSLSCPKVSREGELRPGGARAGPEDAP